MMFTVKMEEKQEEEASTSSRVVNGVGGVVVEEHWWWATASGAQLCWGVSKFKKGYAGDSRFMPVKAFAVASLFVGAASSAAVASIRAYGIHSVDDLKAVGANIRSGLGLRPRTRDE